MLENFLRDRATIERLRGGLLARTWTRSSRTSPNRVMPVKP